MSACSNPPKYAAPGRDIRNQLVSALRAHHPLLMLDDAFATKMLRARNTPGHRFPLGMMQTALQRERAHEIGGGAADESGAA